MKGVISPGGALHIFWVRGRAIRKGIDFPDIGIKTVSIFTILVKETVPIFKVLV